MPKDNNQDKNNDNNKKPEARKKSLSKSFNEFEMDMDIPGLRKKPEKLADAEPAKPKRGIHDGIFDDDTPEDRPVFNIARRLLPKTPEVSLALREISNLEASNLTMAATIEEEYRGKLPAETVDSLTAAALLIGADNLRRIIPKFEKETVRNLVGFSGLAVPEGGDVMPYESYPDNARRLFMALMTTELHLTKAAFKTKNISMERKDLGVIASNIIRESKVGQAGKKACDVSMLARAVKEYNEVTRLSGIPVILVLNADNTVSGHSRNMPKPPKPGL